MLSQLGVVYSIPFPNVYANLLRWLSLLEINLPEMLPLECIWSLSFYVALLLRTLLLPALGLAFVAMRAARAPRRAVDAMGSALFVILFLYGWNQYLWPLLIGTDARMQTIVIGMSKMIDSAGGPTDWNMVMATAILALLPPVLVVVLMQRWFVKGLVETEK